MLQSVYCYNCTGKISAPKANELESANCQICTGKRSAPGIRTVHIHRSKRKRWKCTLVLLEIVQTCNGKRSAEELESVDCQLFSWQEKNAKEIQSTRLYLQAYLPIIHYSNDIFDYDVTYVNNIMIIVTDTLNLNKRTFH